MVLRLFPAKAIRKKLVALPLSVTNPLQPVAGVPVEKAGLDAVKRTYQMISEPLYQKVLFLVARKISHQRKNFLIHNLLHD